MDEPHRVTGYIAWLHILATTPIDDEYRTGVTITRPARPGKPNLPAVLDCSALPLDMPEAHPNGQDNKRSPQPSHQGMGA